jgi:hypothetical protein
MMVALINSWACPAGKILVGRFHLSDLDQRLCRLAGPTVAGAIRKTERPAPGPYFGFNWLRLSE